MSGRTTMWSRYVVSITRVRVVVHRDGVQKRCGAYLGWTIFVWCVGSYVRWKKYGVVRAPRGVVLDTEIPLCTGVWGVDEIVVLYIWRARRCHRFRGLVNALYLWKAISVR